MGCPARRTRKSFLGFSWNAELGHEWTLNQIETHAFDSWVVTEKCEHCTCRRVIRFYSNEKLLRYIGFLPKIGISGIIFTDEIKRQRGISDGNES